jgi:predicted transcriptional regulator
MGDRFYRAQIKATGSCPGFNKPKKGNRKMAWDDDKRAAVVQAYEKAKPTAETSMDIVKEIADDMGESANGVRMVLTKAGVYIKKSEGAASKGASTAKAATGTRVSKAGAQEAITAALRDAGQEIDEDVVSKLTGKAAMYFATIISNLNK